MAKENEVKKLFTVILTNYNNQNYIEESLSSIFSQDYPNIELIITDDCSSDFDSSKIEKFISNYKRKNITNIQFVFNKTNLGTVKTLNKALTKAHGDYILFFASDDKLPSNDVLTKYVSRFERTKYNVITSRWILCDSALKPMRNYVNPIKGWLYNRKLSRQYYNMCIANQYGAGSTCYRKCIFEKYAPIDEKYKLLEDWPFWLKLISNGETIFFDNFDGLFHRCGGVSNSTVDLDSKKFFYYDILNLYRDDIMPALNRFSIYKRLKILRSYDQFISEYSRYVDVDKYRRDFNKYVSIDWKMKNLWRFYKYSPHVLEKIIIMIKHNIVIPITVILSLLVDFIVVNGYKLSNNMILIMSMVSYLIIYCLVSVFHGLFNALKRGR